MRSSLAKPGSDSGSIYRENKRLGNPIGPPLGDVFSSYIPKKKNPSSGASKSAEEKTRAASNEGGSTSCE